MTFFYNKVWKFSVFILLSSGAHMVADIIDESCPTHYTGADVSPGPLRDVLSNDNYNKKSLLY